MNAQRSFRIHNHLKVPISIVAYYPGNGTTPPLPVDVTMGVIPSSRIREYTMGVMERIFVDGIKLKLYMHGMVDDDRREWSTPSKTLYGEYNLKMEAGRSLKAFHVGMITSRFISMSVAYQVAASGLNNVQGMPWVTIHNEGNVPLRLNNNIRIPPHSSTMYKGRDHFGVRLGTVFEDIDGRYPTYVWTVPSTDIYYGVVSDTEQSLYGGYQVTKTFDPVNTGIIFPLEMGWMGGPALPGIPYGYIPQMGNPSTTGPVNRWGEGMSPLDAALLRNPVGPPVMSRSSYSE